ncbi:MAG: DUF1439 domain-containing protein [Rhodoferax sp.]|nr:DUF1439 domain-containing protein [Rhodoferax sp.]
MPKHFSRTLSWIGLAITLLLAACVGGKPAEMELSFTERELQAALNKADMSTRLLDGLVVVSVTGQPQVKLGQPPERIGIAAQLSIKVVGLPVMPASVKGSSGLRYDDAQKAFFLDAPQLDAVTAPLLPKAMEGAARTAITRQLAASFNKTPVYSLKTDGSLKEQAARQTLKSVRIEPDRIVARFGLL